VNFLPEMSVLAQEPEIGGCAAASKITAAWFGGVLPWGPVELVTYKKSEGPKQTARLGSAGR